MSFGIKLSPGAVRQLNDQTEEFQHVVTTAFKRLAESPARYSRPSATAREGQLAEVPVDQEGVSLWISVVFLYEQDEETLYIKYFGVEYGE
jgi:hypothetical protein